MEEITLNKNDYLAKGSHRAIYLYPLDKNKCVKIVMKERQQFMKARNKHWYKKLRPLSWYDENRKEIKAYKILNKKNPEIFNYIPKFYGIVHTNLGDGMLIDYVNNSFTLLKYIKHYGFNKTLQEELLKISTILYRNNIQTRDPNLNNYVVQVIDENRIQVKLIDGIGNSQLIPLADYITFIGQKQIKRRFNKFCSYLIKSFPKYKKTINKLTVLLQNI